MYQFLVLPELPSVLVELFFQKVFNCLHVVISSGLYSFDPLGVLDTKFGEYLIQVLLLLYYVLDVLLTLSSDLLLEQSLEPF